MIAFVSVGSTSFDALVETTVSKPFLDVLRAKGFSRLIIQRGRSTVKTPGKYIDNEDYVTLNRHGIEIELWKYKPSLRAEMEIADIVISHAGSGTIIEVLRLRKPLIAVPNPTLLDDHQQELAQALEAHGYLRTSSVSDLARTVSTLDPKEIVPFPQFDGSRFANLVDEEIGLS